MRTDGEEEFFEWNMKVALINPQDITFRKKASTVGKRGPLPNSLQVSILHHALTFWLLSTLLHMYFIQGEEKVDFLKLNLTQTGRTLGAVDAWVAMA